MYLYGAMDPKLGQTLKPELSGKAAKHFGNFARRILEQGTPGLESLVREIQHEFRNGGWIETIDGGFVRCPSPHAALNYKLQSAGGIVMKVASIIIDKRIQEKGLDSLKVGDIHDEGQHDCLRRDSREFGKIAVQSIKDAGEELNFKVPLDGNFKRGFTWAKTH